MKTQAECWEKLLDGKILESKKGNKVHFKNGCLHFLNGGAAELFFNFPDVWNIYEPPPKPKTVNVLAYQFKDNGEVRFAIEGGKFDTSCSSRPYWSRLPSLDQKDVVIE